MPRQEYNSGDRVVLRPVGECEARYMNILAEMHPYFELPYVTLCYKFTGHVIKWTIEEDADNHVYDESWFAGRYPLSSSLGRKPNPLCLIGKLLDAEQKIQEQVNA